MDSLSHLVATAVLLDREPITLLGAVAPDMPWYALYPAWLISEGELASALRGGEWPLPPRWVREAHYASHSLLTVATVWVLIRRWRGNVETQDLASLHGSIFAAWLLHILLDVPTHTRERMGPRPFWPLWRWAYDGFSWADHLAGWVARWLRKAP
jgi:membrane-bound metal-dependent hydrolase YbcI (DUF457 family)